MPAKIRLARHGRKARPIYHIVVADSRAPRDGKYIEKLGLYNPNTNPATIDLDFDKSLDWLQKGAQPTDTCRSLLSKKGVMMKKHLIEGAKKGAFSMEEAEKRFDTWLKDKESKLQNAVDKLAKDKQADTKASLEREAKVNQDRAAEVAKKKASAEKSAKAETEEVTEATEEQVQDSAEEATAEGSAE
jgi:small subunit ribosomal protein S16